MLAPILPDVLTPDLHWHVSPGPATGMCLFPPFADPGHICRRHLLALDTGNSLCLRPYRPKIILGRNTPSLPRMYFNDVPLCLQLLTPAGFRTLPEHTDRKSCSQKETEKQAETTKVSARFRSGFRTGRIRYARDQPPKPTT